MPRKIDHRLFGGWAVDLWAGAVTRDRGRVVIPIPGEPIVWSDEPFGRDRPALGEVSCRAIPLALLLAGKTTPRPGAAGAAKDRSDLEVLRRISTTSRTDGRLEAMV